MDEVKDEIRTDGGTVVPGSESEAPVEAPMAETVEDEVIEPETI